MDMETQIAFSKSVQQFVESLEAINSMRHQHADFSYHIAVERQEVELMRTELYNRVKRLDEQLEIMEHNNGCITYNEIAYPLGDLTTFIEHVNRKLIRE